MRMFNNESTQIRMFNNESTQIMRTINSESPQSVRSINQQWVIKVLAPNQSTVDHQSPCAQSINSESAQQWISRLHADVQQ
jgi:hypothetical protein